MKIKTVKKMSLPELINYVWENELYPCKYINNFNGEVVFNDTGKFMTDESFISPNSYFTVEVEGELTEDTEIHGALYVQENGNINGYNKVTKPEGHTWESFARMLINSMPPPTKEHYEREVFIFEKWWREKGYPDGIPDEADYAMEQKRLAPSWRRVCKMLLRNDYWCKGLGFSQHKSSANKHDMVKRFVKIHDEYERGESE